MTTPQNRRLLFALAFVPTVAVSAEEIGFKRYYEQNEFSLTSPAAMRFGLYGYDNPAGLQHVKDVDAALYWASDDFLYDDQRWLGILAGPGVSFSMGRDFRGGGEVSEYKLAFGGGDDGFASGLSIGWYSGDTDAQDLHTHFTYGSLSRPNRYLSYGLTATLATDTEYYQGVLDVAYRPFGTEHLALFADYAVGNDDELDGGQWSVGGASEVLPGVRLTGRYFESGLVTAGVQVSLGHTGFSAQAHRPDAGGDYQTYSVRAGGWDRNVFDAWSEPEDRYLELTLDQEMTYRSLGVFDRRQTLLQTLRTIEAAQQDDTVGGIVVNTARMRIPPAMAWELKAALDAFRASGKQVLMYIERGDMTELLLSSAADEVIMEPNGSLTLPGFVSGSTYLGDLLDHWGIGIEELRNLEYKTAFESLSRDGMSAADREQRQAMIDDFYQLWQSSMRDGRDVSTATFDRLIDRGIHLSPDDLREAGVVDRLARYSDLDDWLEEITGEPRDTLEPDGLRILRTARDDQWGPAHRIAVVYATGMTATDSGMNTRELSETLRELREDDAVKAVVLRVDSPGGDILAADMLAQAVKETQAEKPVVVSMGSVAASGGYWVSMHAGSLLAAPNTVTGSIGVISLHLWDDGLSDRLRLNSDYVARGDSADLRFGIGVPMAGLTLPHRDLTEQERTGLMRRINAEYDQFVSQAAEARDMPQERMRDLAAGRIYSGTQASELGLIDGIGNLSDAVDLARREAGLTRRDKVLLVEYPREGISSLDDLLYLMELQEGGSFAFNPALYRQRYVDYLVHQRSRPLVLMPYEYFEGSLR